MKMRKIIAIVAAVLMLLSILPMAVFAADTYELVTNVDDLAVGDKIIIFAVNDNTVLSTTQNGNNRGKVDATPNGTAITLTDAMQVITVEAGLTEGTYAFNVGNGYLYAASSSKNYLRTETTLTANSSWSVAIDESGVATIKATGSNTRNWLRYNKSSSIFSCYGSGQNDIAIYKLPTGGTDEPECEHEWALTGTTPANCTDAGEENYTCSLCGESKTETIDALGHSYGEPVETVAPDCVNAGEQESTCSVCGDVKTETVKALGHNYVDGFCSVCNEPQPLEATIDFSTTDQRTEYSTSVQKWEKDGLTVTNNKASSSSNVGDYSNPARFYKGSEVIIAYPGMTKLVINGPTGTYGDPWAATLDAASLNYTVDGGVYTVTFATPVDSITLTTTAQVRANSITVYGSAPSDCDHNYVGVVTQAPTCTVEGLMTYTCSECGDEYTEAIAVAPHDYVEDVIDSTCTTTGTKTYECSVCFDSYDEVIPVKNHNYVDDVCADCGHVKVYKGTITFDADKTQRTECTTSVQKWENGGLTFVNNKGESTTNINSDYYGRFYKSSSIVIEFPEMGQLIIDASGIGDDYLWDATLEAAGLSFTVENKIYTITFDEPKNSLELTCANQVRANSITAIVAHDCAYDNAFDVDCNKCGEIREVEIFTNLGSSVREEIDHTSGLAALFSINAPGLKVAEGHTTLGDYANATVNGYELIKMGAVVSNGVSTVNIEARYLFDVQDDSVQFAARIINIPEENYDTQITFTPYVIVKIDGEQVTIYDEAIVNSYNGITE